MDTELARTFLAVVTAGNFVSAAERLHVTQSTVSTRIQSLEGTLGRKLFVRNKGGTTLTPAGQRFQKHASTLIRTLEHARHDIGMGERFRGTVTIGARFGLWEQFLMKALPDLLREAPDIAVRAEIALEEQLMQGLVEGHLDIGVMYTPQSRPGLKVEHIFDERLVFASTDPAGKAEPGPGYVYVDWGPEFFAKHSASFPYFPGAELTANIGWLGLEHVLQNGGSGYFPLRLLRPHLLSRKLSLVSGAPEFSLSAYLVHPSDSKSDAIRTVLKIIRNAGTAENKRSQEH